jgi:hypothetical protein
MIAIGQSAIAQTDFQQSDFMMNERDLDPAVLESNRKLKTHRMLAWGVLGSASDGLPFLPTHPVVFRSM